MNNHDRVCEEPQDGLTMGQRLHEAERLVARSWKALGKSDCWECLKNATASIGWSIEAVCVALDMNYHPFRPWLDNLVGRIPPESVDCVFAQRYYEMARELFFATKGRVPGRD